MSDACEACPQQEAPSSLPRGTDTGRCAAPRCFLIEAVFVGCLRVFWWLSARYLVGHCGILVVDCVGIWWALEFWWLIVSVFGGSLREFWWLSARYLFVARSAGTGARSVPAYGFVVALGRPEQSAAAVPAWRMGVALDWPAGSRGFPISLCRSVLVRLDVRSPSTMRWTIGSSARNRFSNGLPNLLGEIVPTNTLDCCA